MNLCAKPVRLPAFCLALVMCVTHLLADLPETFEALTQGRAYRHNLRNVSRKTMVGNFLREGEPAARPPGMLRHAIDSALEVRNDPNASEEDTRHASVMLNEALEALIFGYHAAGNRDLLNGTRVSFPASSGANEERTPPAGTTASFQSPAIQSLYYAHLYFMEGIKEAVAVLQRDPGSALRALDASNGDPSYFTRWNNPENLPREEYFDSTLQESDAWSLTAAALLGKSVRRFGGTVTTLADKLWRAAHFHPETSRNRDAALQEASEFLKCNMHAQFLASLPIAATLNDGVALAPDATGKLVPTRNEYQEVGADSVRVNVTGAQILAGRIARGERPKQADLVPRWDKPTIDAQLRKLGSLSGTVREAWTAAETAINEFNSANVATVSDSLDRRQRFKFRLWQITGIHPDENPGGEQFDKPEGRAAYVKTLEDWVFDKTANFNPSDDWFTAPLTGRNDPATGRPPSVSEISELGFASLRMVQALNEVKSMQARIDSYVQRIQIEEWRNGAVADISENEAKVIGAMEAAEFLASAFEVSICICGVSSGSEVKQNGGAALRGVNAPIKRFIQTRNQTKINGVNSQATIQNLLVEQSLLSEQFPNVLIQAQLAVNEVQRLFAESEQLVEDYAYHVNAKQDLWFNDPEILFEKSQAEERYEELIQTYQGELYLLAKMLEKAWVEPYENPVLNAAGAYEQFANDTRFDLFPDSEAVFAIGNHNQCNDFLDALRSWNNHLAGGRRGVLSGGRSQSLTDAIVISVREHLLGLDDLRFEQGRFVVDPVLRHENIRRFRSFVQRGQTRAKERGFELRIDFPFKLEQTVETEGLDEPDFLFSALGVADPNVWNRRILGVGVELVGNNVTQGTSTTPNRIPVSLYLHGNVSRESKFLDSLFTQQNRTVVTDLRLFQYDPYELTLLGNDGFFKIDNLVATSNNLQPDPLSPQQIPHVEWPLGCDNWVFLVRDNVAQFNWENLDDIKLYVYWEAGPPVTLANNYGWPN